MIEWLRRQNQLYKKSTFEKQTLNYMYALLRQYPMIIFLLGIYVLPKLAIRVASRLCLNRFLLDSIKYGLGKIDSEMKEIEFGITGSLSALPMRFVRKWRRG